MSEVYVRDGLFVRDWKKYTKLHLVDRCFNDLDDGPEKEKLHMALAWLQDLKYIFQGLGPIPFTIQSEKTPVRKTDIKKGIAACVLDDGERKGR